MGLFKNIAAAGVVALLAGCGGGGGSAAPAPVTSGPPGSGNPSVKKVTLSGQVTFGHVPHKTRGFGLDYNAITPAPARGIVVVLLDENNGTVEQTLTDADGNYSFSVDASKDVKVQARAQMRRSGQWDVKITDNTLDNATYVMEGSLNSAGTQAVQTRDLHAPSGWNGNSYTSQRVAAPFAILSPVYDSIQAVRAADSAAVFPALEYRWSPDNRPVIGNKALGQIGTSGYHRDENAVYLLGAADTDTDEYDPHVIIHEWGHYFEHHLSRLDSMGGRHSLSDKLDPRLAFSEGFGNGLAAIITGDPEYKDSSGPGQDAGFEIDFENVSSSRAGWFNEGSVAAILYDIADEDADGNDRINAGFAPIYHAMTSDRVLDGDVFATIFSFSDAISERPEINSLDYRDLLNMQNISSADAQAAGERNNGAIASSLPVYKEVSVNGAPVTVCSVDDAGRFNKLGNREFVYFEVPSDGRYELLMSLISGDGERDPDFSLWQAGEIVLETASSVSGEEREQATLSAGNYLAEAYDFYNINGTSDRIGDACFEFSIRAL